MKILCIGDVCGSCGCNTLRKLLPALKLKHNIDLCIVNGENSHDKNGIVKQTSDDIFVSGADIITTGNHVFRRKEFYEVLDNNDCVIRPANYTEKAHGKGYTVYDMGRVQVGVINLLGFLYVSAPINPFSIVDKIVYDLKSQGVKIIILDFHAEATSEKRAMGFYLDGRVSAMFGTHTHIQTSDAQILPKGTGYITDVGMTGAHQSVLGIAPEIAIAKVKDMLPAPFEFANGESILCGVIFDIDEKTGKCNDVQSICEYLK